MYKATRAYRLDVTILYINNVLVILLTRMANFNLDNNQKRTIFCLLLGYAGYYFCRSNLSVSAPLLIKEFSSVGLNKVALGGIVSTGVLVYAFGKILNGIFGDFFGGKKTFILGMLGSIVATIFFGLGGGITAFTTFWLVNRYFQSMGWSALVKTVGQLFDHISYARIMGILSLSFLFGDMIARYLFGWIISLNFGWREIFYFSAAVFSLIALINIIFLPKNKINKNLTPHPKTLFRDSTAKINVLQLLLPILKSPAFWIVAIMSVGLTVIRETFNFWIPTYLTEVVKYSPSEAAKFSMLFPFFGGLSVICFGFFTDNKMKGLKSKAIIISLLILTVLLLMLYGLNSATPKYIHLILISLSAFMIVGPYSFLAGAISLDIGGPKASSTVAGLVDSAGYFGATYSGIGIAQIATVYGWNKVFLVLAIVSLVTLIASNFYKKIFEVALVSKDK